MEIIIGVQNKGNRGRETLEKLTAGSVIIGRIQHTLSLSFMSHHDLHAEVQTLQTVSVYNFITVPPITPRAALSVIRSVKMYHFISAFHFNKICLLTLRFKKAVLHLTEHTVREKEVYIF